MAHVSKCETWSSVLICGHDGQHLFIIVNQLLYSKSVSNIGNGINGHQFVVAAIEGELSTLVIRTIATTQTAATGDNNYNRNNRFSVDRATRGVTR